MIEHRDVLFQRTLVLEVEDVVSRCIVVQWARLLDVEDVEPVALVQKVEDAVLRCSEGTVVRGGG